jgi:hypothetical protein
VKCDGCKWRGFNRTICVECDKQVGDTASLPSADLEPASCHEPMAEKKSETLDTPSGSRVRLHIHSKRKRLCDADGISGKAAIDGLVYSGLLRDDSPEFVESVSYSQEKCDYEETIITIEEI